ncbi:tetratricopeptide repeat protein [Poritiphilus flavus]|uniref:Uncharacterized protein n=1 Tax=Poritiphilus flavus TaxID=2697053 RepID=A0A6L9EFZ4_9FLAO|nr:tetratricopeptide repeat protein [Poritiphilus flavus]NAS13684.1 hypothetical protein [Poritiphilus flavus]
MKTNIFKSILLVVLSITLTNNAIAQEKLTAEQWQADLDYLQEQVHSEYPFLFKKITQEAWDKQVADLRAEIPSLAEHEIKVGLSRMVSAFEYGHTQVPFSTLAKDAVLAVNLYHFKDGIHVEGVQKDDSKALGAKVLAINGMPIEEALSKIRPVVPAENEQYFKGYGLRFLTVPSVLHAQGITETLQQEVSLSLEKDGKRFTHSFSAIPLEDMSRDYLFTKPNENWLSVRDAAETPFYLKQLNDKYFYFELLEGTKTLYVRQSSVFDHPEETLKDFYARLFNFIDTQGVEKLIYDVRLNGGGNNYNNIHFMKGIMARPELNKKGNFFFVIGRNTFSACQNLTNDVETFTEAILVGEPTSENKNFYGDNQLVQLPNSGVKAYLSFAWWQDKPQWENADATTPNFYAEPTFEEYRTNQDPVLSLIDTIDPETTVIDPMAYFTQLFGEGKLEQLKTDANRIIRDPKYQHINFEKEFSQVGQMLLDQQQYQPAAFVFGTFVENFPENASFWEGLGTALKALGQTEQAEEALAKAKSLE